MTDKRLAVKILEFIQRDIPVSARPFAGLAGDLGCSEKEIMEVIRDLQRCGIVRRYGAILRHQQAGYNVNAMVAWQVPEGLEDAAGAQMALHRQVSHCYCREVPADFPYRLFTMIHAQSEKELQDLVETLATQTDLDDFVLLPSVKEYKKVSMQYRIKADLLKRLEEDDH